jgi:hypothetical protein
MRRTTTVLMSILLLFIMVAPAGASWSNLPRATTSFNDEVRSIAYDGDVLYVGGRFSHAKTVQGSYWRRHFLAAVDSTTGDLLPFRPVLDGQVLDVAVGGGYLYAAGEFKQVDGVSMPRLARFDLATGELDAAWRPRPSALVFTVEPAGDRVYIGGQFASVGGVEQRNLAAVDADTGALVPEFAPAIEDGSVRDLEVAHGRLYVAGAFRAVAGERGWRKLVAVDLATGELDRAFHSAMPALIWKTAPHSDRVYPAVNGRGGELRSFDTTGATQWYLGTDGGVQAVAVHAGVIVAGGHFERVCNSNRSGPQGECVDGIRERRGHAFAASRDGALLEWNPGANSHVGVWDFKSHPEGANLGAGGAFLGFGGGEMTQRGMAIFD